MNEQIQEIRYQVGEAWKGTYNPATSYGNANVVQDSTGLSVYRSLKPGNAGHPLSDTSWWFCIIDLSSIKEEADRIAATDSEMEAHEAERVSAEQQRVSKEQARVNAETARIQAEQTRASQESERVSQEQTRVNQEQVRVSQEETRATQENQRMQAEEQRAAKETQRVNAEQQRVLAEQNRVSAEQDRIDSELARVQNEQTRLQRAEADHQTAVADHETAVHDNEVAVADHETAVADHTTAESDHARAESDHGTAATDHTTAGADHTQAGADHTASEAATTAANTAAAAADAAREGIQDDLARKANIDGSYETMSVGLAKNLEGRTDVTGSFLERTTGGDAEVANGLAQMQEVGGKSQVWNQLIKVENSSTTTSGITYTKNSQNNTISLNGTSTSSGYFQFLVQNNVFSPNHKFLLWSPIVSGSFSGNDVFWGQPGASSTQKNIGQGYIIEITNATFHQLMLYIKAGATINNLVFHPQLIDLTLLFGSGNEPETVEEFESWLESNIGLREYYPYNAGTVLNVNMTGIETLGFNLLDPATGKARIIGAYSDVYGNYYGITGTHGTITFTSDLGETSTITPDSDGKFLLEEPGELTVADAGADCSVFLWWDGTKTEHEDYERTVTNLDVAHIYGKLNGTGDLVKVHRGCQGLLEGRGWRCGRGEEGWRSGFGDAYLGKAT